MWTAVPILEDKAWKGEVSMSGRPLLAAASGSNTQSGGPGATQKQSDRPGGKPKRTLIESACAACRKRKSRCDGARPACSRCQALQTECQYQAEEGESRWSALKRHSKALQKERDDATELIGLLQARPEPEAQEIYRQIRMSGSGGNIGALMHQIRDRGLIDMTPRRYSLPHQQPLPPHSTFPMPGGGAQPQPSAGPQLPPLRSVVELPPPGTANVQPRQVRNSSLASAISDGSYSSPSSSDMAGSSISPRDLQHGWS